MQQHHCTANTQLFPCTATPIPANCLPAIDRYALCCTASGRHDCGLKPETGPGVACIEQPPANRPSKAGCNLYARTPPHWMLAAFIVREALTALSRAPHESHMHSNNQGLMKLLLLHGHGLKPERPSNNSHGAASCSTLWDIRNLRHSTQPTSNRWKVLGKDRLPMLTKDHNCAYARICICTCIHSHGAGPVARCVRC